MIAIYHYVHDSVALLQKQTTQYFLL